MTPSREDLRAWAKEQTRITNGMLRKQYGVDYEEADTLYRQLKEDGIAGRMGYVYENC